MAATRNAALFATLSERFARNRDRHPDVDWSAVEARIATNASALAALAAMEETGGEPDVTGEERGRFIFCDCAPESPAGRRSLCYDLTALEARKEAKPRGDAKSLAASMGIEMLNEAQYRALQALGEFDRKTSSWIATPAPVRALGGALFCDRRYGQIFTYHNGAESYYAARGFRGRIAV